MNSRERVRMALNHQEADRVPMDLWGSASRIHTELYKKIADEMGFKEYDALLRPGTTTQYVDYRLSDAVGCDFRHINIGKPDHFQSHQDKDGNVIDEWGIGKKLMAGYNAITYHPLAGKDLDFLKKYQFPTAKDPGRIRGLAEQARNWYQNTKYAITATSAVSGIFFELGQYLRGADNFMMDLYDQPEFVHLLLEKLTETIIDLNLYYMEPIAPYIEWIEFTEDFAMQNSLFISPQMFREYFKKPHIELFTAIKKKFPQVKIFFHSCGAVRGLIPDLIETGIDILNPLQPLATGMDSTELKREFGKTVVFHGGIDIQYAMPGSFTDIEQEVKKRIKALAPGGGYILSPTNHLQIDVPVANFFKLYELAGKYGKYPISIEQ